LSGSMPVARFVGKGRIELEERPVPAPGPDEVLVKVHTCAVCGSDRRAYVFGSSVTPGHEVSGEVVDTGSEVHSSHVGRRGVVYLVAPCGSCYACGSGATNMCLRKRAMYGFTADGGYAGYLKVHADCFLEVDVAIELDRATALLDLFGISGHAFRRAGPPPPLTVAVLGCGPIGLGAIAVARALGIEQLWASDVSKDRLKLARRLGAACIDASLADPVEQFLGRVREGFDVVIEAVGLSATHQQAIRIAAPGGRVVFVAHNRSSLEVRTLEDLIQLERSLVGSQYFPLHEFQHNHALLLSGELDPGPILTHRFPLARIGDAFELFMSGHGGKVLIQP
jgi:threonine dehydrogenase-like Zn-dependent dehydrogenase